MEINVNSVQFAVIICGTLILLICIPFVIIWIRSRMGRINNFGSDHEEARMADNIENKETASDIFSHPKLKLLMNELRKESERGVAIISSAYLDDRLGGLIRAYLHLDDNQYKDLLRDAHSPLGSFGTRIMVAEALGLIIDRSSFDIIRKIRNDFAHNIDVSFDDSPISDRCDSLKGRYKIPSIGLKTRRDVFESTVFSLIGGVEMNFFIVTNHNISGNMWDIINDYIQLQEGY